LPRNLRFPTPGNQRKSSSPAGDFADTTLVSRQAFRSLAPPHRGGRMGHLAGTFDASLHPSAAMQDFEKLGVFYLGRGYDIAARKARPELLLYDAKDLTTHGVCVGMTGSGKTGLCLALLEEAAIDGIPALVIDPKGDLSNLLLTFPELRPEDFRPWVDP